MSLYQKGVEHYLRRDFTRARAIFQSILERDPENVRAKRALERLDRAEQAQ